MIKIFYKGEYQSYRLEYCGTHKQQSLEQQSITSVNSCSLYNPFKKL